MKKVKKSTRDLKLTKICHTCGKRYHPTNNSYKLLSKYCSPECFRSSLKKKSIVQKKYEQILNNEPQYSDETISNFE